LQAECLSQSGDASGVESEYDQDVEAVTLFLDRIGELALPPAVYTGDGPSIVLNSLAYGIEGGDHRFFVEVGAQDGNNLVSAHSARSLPLD
jgi:hypothetical protein